MACISTLTRIATEEPDDTPAPGCRDITPPQKKMDAGDQGIAILGGSPAFDGSGRDRFVEHFASPHTGVVQAGEGTALYRKCALFNDAPCSRPTRQQPVIVVDLDGLHVHHNRDIEKTVQHINVIRDQGYEVIAMTHARTPAEYQNAVSQFGSFGVRVLDNDYHDSYYNRYGAGFGETQIEKLKRLKFEDSLPIVGVVTRPPKRPAEYARAGISVISFTENLGAHKEGLIRSSQEMIKTRSAPGFNPHEYLWDGLTSSREILGNAIEFMTENEKIREGMFRVINNARTFILVANYALSEDRWGKKLIDLLIKKASAGVRVKIILDSAMVEIGFLGEEGVDRLTQETIKKMRAAGIEIRLHTTDHYPDSDLPLFGLATQWHRKIVMADEEEGQVSVHCGGGVLSGTSLSNDRTEQSALESLLVQRWTGQGAFKDYFAMIRGPVAGVAYEEFRESWVEYGGSPDDLPFIGPQRSYSQDASLRYVYHDPYNDQNTLNVILLLLNDRRAGEVTLVNSFAPTGRIVSAMMAAAQKGKKIRYVISQMHPLLDSDRDAVLEQILAAGIEVYVVRGKVHAKVYANDFNIAFGSHNLDYHSLSDAEELVVLNKKSAEAKPLVADIEKMITEAYPLHLDYRNGVRGDPLVAVFYEATSSTAPVNLPLDDEGREKRDRGVLSMIASLPVDVARVLTKVGTGVLRDAAQGHQRVDRAVSLNLIYRNFKVDRARVHTSHDEETQPRQSQVSNLPPSLVPYAGLSLAMGQDPHGFLYGASTSPLAASLVSPALRLKGAIEMSAQEMILSIGERLQTVIPYAPLSWLQLRAGVAFSQSVFLPFDDDHKPALSFTGEGYLKANTPYGGAEVSLSSTLATAGITHNPHFGLSRGWFSPAAPLKMGASLFTPDISWGDHTLTLEAFGDYDTRAVGVGGTARLNIYHAYPRAEKFNVGLTYLHTEGEQHGVKNKDAVSVGVGVRF
ncbi:MAG: phosphatidylserine/phosphatidylglycerophosphate/cardiolipin synthase family protein [Deltaproteobacteria bacterium]|nr:phosphatidylserine/phosphatidylglycerophosphate/cardiolipin synthase family protein [Deltaproteobacteria bacterium]